MGHAVGVRRRFACAAAFAMLVAGCSSSSNPHTAATPSHRSSASASPSYGGTVPLSVAIPRIETFVESERGLKFKHKVKVTLLSTPKFVPELKNLAGRRKPTKT